MDNNIFLYLNLLIPIRLVMSKDMDVLTKNINIGLYSMFVPLMNNIILSAISIDKISKGFPP